MVVWGSSNGAHTRASMGEHERARDDANDA